MAGERYSQHGRRRQSRACPGIFRQGVGFARSSFGIRNGSGSPGARYQSAGQLDKAAKNAETDRTGAPLILFRFPNSPLTHAKLAESEEALRTKPQALRLAPRCPIEAGQVMADYVRLDRFEARAIARKHFAQGFDTPQVHRFLLAIAWIEDDQQVAASQIQWFTGKPENTSLWKMRRSTRGRVASCGAYANCWNGPQTSHGGGMCMTSAARLLAPNVDREALIGNCEPARDTGAASPVSLGVSAARRNGTARKSVPKRHQNSGPMMCSGTASTVTAIRCRDSITAGDKMPGPLRCSYSVKYERAYPVARYLRGLAFL